MGLSGTRTSAPLGSAFAAARRIDAVAKAMGNPPDEALCLLLREDPSPDADAVVLDALEERGLDMSEHSPEERASIARLVRLLFGWSEATLAANLARGVRP